MADGVLRSFKLLAVARLAAQLITWVITLVVIRLLSPEDYGLMALVGMVLGLFALINDVGLSAALIQKQDVAEDIRRSIFGAMIVLNLTLFAVVLLIAQPAQTFFASPGLFELLCVSAAQLLMNPVITLTDATLRREMRFAEKSRIEFVSGVGGGVISLTMALLGFGVWSLVGGLLAVGGIKAIMGTIVCRGLVVPRFAISGMGQVLGFGGYVTADRLMWFVANQADVFLAGRLLGQQLLGVYSIAYQLVSLPMQKLSSILNDVGFAAFSRLQNDRRAAIAAYLKASRLTGFFAFPVFVGLGMVAPKLVVLLLGPQWALSGELMMLMCFAFPLKMLNTVSNNLLMGLGHARTVAGFGLFGVIVAPVAYAVAILNHGLSGLAMALPLVAMLQFGLTSWVTMRKVDCSLWSYVRNVLPASLFAALMAGTVLFVFWFNWQIELLAGLTWGADAFVIFQAVIVGAGVFGLCVLLFARDVVHTARAIVRS